MIDVFDITFAVSGLKLPHIVVEYISPEFLSLEVTTTVRDPVPHFSGADDFVDIIQGEKAMWWNRGVVSQLLNIRGIRDVWCRI